MASSTDGPHADVLLEPPDRGSVLEHSTQHHTGGRDEDAGVNGRSELSLPPALFTLVEILGFDQNVRTAGDDVSAHLWRSLGRHHASAASRPQHIHDSLPFAIIRSLGWFLLLASGSREPFSRLDVLSERGLGMAIGGSTNRYIVDVGTTVRRRSTILPSGRSLSLSYVPRSLACELEGCRGAC